MVFKKVYTGIGSRVVPDHIEEELAHYAERFDRKGFTVRTGDAQGCDSIFRESERTEVYDPLSITELWPNFWAYKEVQLCMPNDRWGYNNWKPYVRALTARNMQQVLGKNGEGPSDFVLCYAPSVHYADSSAGGTGYAIRCALLHKIPVYNIYSSTDKKLFEEEVLSIV